MIHVFLGLQVTALSYPVCNDQTALTLNTITQPNTQDLFSQINASTQDTCEHEIALHRSVAKISNVFQFGTEFCCNASLVLLLVASCNDVQTHCSCFCAVHKYMSLLPSVAELSKVNPVDDIRISPHCKNAHFVNCSQPILSACMSASSVMWPWPPTARLEGSF